MFSLEFFIAIERLVLILLFLAAVWIFGRIGDNVNKIRKMLEQELRRREHS